MSCSSSFIVIVGTLVLVFSSLMRLSQDIAVSLFAKRVRETVAWTQNVKDRWFVDI